MTTILAPAKVNLCLFLGPTRSDGRHELVTVFQAVTLADVLTVASASVDEVICPGVEGPNLAARALELLREAGWSAPPVRVEIDKRIPVAAGMGGGSTDAAAVLALANELPFTVLYAIAGDLGADVPALLEPGLALGTAAGDMVTRFSRLAEHAYVVLPSDFALSTADVYREADRLGLARSMADLDAFDRQLRSALLPGARFPSDLIVNDLQPAALSRCPSIQAALDALLEAGAQQAIVSGSGPTSVGIWWGDGAAEAAEAAATSLSPRFRGAQAALPFAGSSQFDPTA
jgi:4-diphosphocytidyl-2-C-methyl-D-erythritol kinase